MYVFDQNGDTLSKRFLMTYTPQDSVVHDIRQTRTTSDGVDPRGVEDVPILGPYVSDNGNGGSYHSGPVLNKHQ